MESDHQRLEGTCKYATTGLCIQIYLMLFFKKNICIIIWVQISYCRSLSFSLFLSHTHAQANKRDSKGERKQERNRKKDDKRLVLGSDPEAVKNNWELPVIPEKERIYSDTFSFANRPLLYRWTEGKYQCSWKDGDRFYLLKK